MGQAEVKVPGGGAANVLGVGMDFQKVGRGNSAPCQRNHVRLDTAFLGVATVTDPVSVPLKYIDHWEVKVIAVVVNSEIGAEGTPIVVLGNYTLIGNIVVWDRRLHKTEITEVFPL